MPAELPTIASCPHCGTILIRTPRVLVHPMWGEREQIRRTLGGFWVEHAHTRFDGRIHHCPGRRRPVYDPDPSAQESIGAERPETCDSIRGREGRGAYLLAMVFGLVACTQSSAQDELRALRLRRSAPFARVDGSRAGRSRSPLADVPALWDIEPESRDAERFFEPLPRTARPGPVRRHERVEVAGESHVASAKPGPGEVESWRGLELASGRYQVVDTIREDVAGVVYLAHDRNLDSHVDVEVPALARDEKPAATIEFVRAVRSLARLGHPHLAKVTEVGTYREAPFVVAEHLSGGSLRFRLQVGADGGPVPVAPQMLEEWLPDVASALDYLHSQGRVYLDVGPANILFDAQGRAYLGGLAMSEAVAERMDAGSGTGPELSQCRGQAVTLAPEILEGEEPNGRSDQYALAATVYELLSGQPPFPGQTLAGIAARRSSSEAQDLRMRNPSIPPSLSSAVLRGLKRDPQERYPDCTAFARAVLAAVHEPVPLQDGTMVLAAHPTSAEPPELPRSGPSRTRSSGPAAPSRLAALGLAGSMLVAAAGVTLWRRATGKKRGQRPEDRPNRSTDSRLRLSVGRAPASADAESGRRRSVPPRPRCSEIIPQPAAIVTSSTPPAPPARESRQTVRGIGQSLAHQSELEAPRNWRRGHLGQSLLPVPYLPPGATLPAPQQRAAEPEPDRVASRVAS